MAAKQRYGLQQTHQQRGQQRRNDGAQEVDLIIVQAPPPLQQRTQVTVRQHAQYAGGESYSYPVAWHQVGGGANQRQQNRSRNAGQGAGQADAAIGAGGHHLPGGNQIGAASSSLPVFAGNRIRSRFRQRCRDSQQPQVRSAGQH